jgi:hypothetical protein
LPARNPDYYYPIIVKTGVNSPAFPVVLSSEESQVV